MASYEEMVHEYVALIDNKEEYYQRYQGICEEAENGCRADKMLETFVVEIALNECDTLTYDVVDGIVAELLYNYEEEHAPACTPAMAVEQGARDTLECLCDYDKNAYNRLQLVKSLHEEGTEGLVRTLIKNELLHLCHEARVLIANGIADTIVDFIYNETSED